MDIPEDIKQAATRIAGAYLDRDVSCEKLYRDVAEALMAERLAERARCAKVAEETGREYCRDHFVMMGPAGIAHKIAAAIRQPEPR